MTESVLDAAANHVDEASKDPHKAGRLAFGTVTTLATGADAAISLYSKAGSAASVAGGNSPPLAPSARTIVSQTQGIADDAMVHFGPEPYSTIKPSPGGDFAHGFQYGDIKHLTPGQVEGAIGTLAESGKKGGAGFMHVLDKPAKVELNGIVPGTKIPEYTFEGETAVKSTHELKR